VWPFTRRDTTEDREALSLEQVIALDAAPTYAGVGVDSDSALRLSAVWGCVGLLADLTSTMPLLAYRAGARQPVETEPLLFTAPAADTDLSDWLYEVMMSLLLRGNFYGLVVARSGAERPTQIEPLHPDRITVTVMPDQHGVVYRLDGSPIERDDLFHLRAYRMPGSVVGLSPIRYHAETIGLGLAAQQFGARFFGDNATPSGLLTSEQRLTGDQARQLHDRWKATRGGQRGTAVLGEGLKFQPISVAPEESQFLESQRFSVQQVARIYRVPPELLGSESGNSMTYANIESRDLTLLKYALNPWLTRLERTLTRLLPRGTYCKFNRGQLLETDLLTRYQSYEIGLRAGFLTIDEVRELEDREPLPAPRPAIERPGLGSVA